jgi:hypothetical protein
MNLPDVIGKTCRELGYEQWHHDMHMREFAQVIETKLPIKGEVWPPEWMAISPSRLMESR